jgi:hypothetical protein
MSKLELIKELECLIAFQSDCLAKGNWEDFDKAENSIARLENKILSSNEIEASPPHDSSLVLTEGK